MSESETTQPKNEEESITYRGAVPGDAAFIMSTWLKGLRFGNDWFWLIEPKAYFSHYHKVIEAILSRPGINIKIACLKSDPDTILGYSVFEGERLDWIHVKKVWRNRFDKRPNKLNIAKNLIPGNITTVSHLTAIGRAMLSRRPGVVFNPFL